jgi:hypothetical protein
MCRIFDAKNAFSFSIKKIAGISEPLYETGTGAERNGVSSLTLVWHLTSNNGAECAMQFEFILCYS